MKEIDVKALNKKIVAQKISQVVSKHYGSEVLSIKYVGGGSFGMAYKVEQNKSPNVLIAKAYKSSGMHKTEALSLQTLAKSCTSVKFPKVYFTCDENENTQFDLLCMEFVEGKNAFLKFNLLLKSKKKKLAFADKIIDAMLEIHNVSNEKFGDIENPIYTNWLDYYKPFALDILKTARQLCYEKKLEKYIVETMEKAYIKFDDIFNEKIEKSSLIHGDLNLMNIMIKKKFEVSAIIDPLNSMYADREYDLFQLNNLTGKYFMLYKQYKRKYQVSKNCDIKCAFYGLWNEVYCFITAGTMIKFIMNPLIKNMKKQLILSYGK